MPPVKHRYPSVNFGEIWYEYHYDPVRSFLKFHYFCLNRSAIFTDIRAQRSNILLTVKQSKLRDFP